jgi:hypothetical protein
MPDNKFGIISSNTTLLDDMDDYLSDSEPDIKPISKETKVTPEPKKDEEIKGTKEKIITVEKPKPLTEDDLLGTEGGEEDSDEESKEGNEEEQGGNTFEALAEELYNIGIFTTDEDEEPEPILTGEQLKERFELEKRKGVMEVLDQFLNSKGEEARDVFENLYVHGVDPVTYIEKFAKVKDFEGLDMTSEDNQVKVLRELYKREKKKDIEARI